MTNDEQVLFYNGIPTLNARNAIFDVLRPQIAKITLWRGSATVVNCIRALANCPRKFGPPRMLISKDQLLLVLMNLRLGLLSTDLAQRFCISASTVTRIWNTWVPFLANELPMIPPPQIEAVRQSLPSPFRVEQYSSTRHIIDCSEIFIETPKNLDLAMETWSDYKHYHTAKFLISINPSGT